jgi:hypothetical protein
MNYDRNLMRSSSPQKYLDYDIEEEQRLKMKDALLRFSVFIFNK